MSSNYSWDKTNYSQEWVNFKEIFSSMCNFKDPWFLIPNIYVENKKFCYCFKIYILSADQHSLGFYFLRRILSCFKLNPFEYLNLSFDSSIDDVKKQYRKVMSSSCWGLFKLFCWLLITYFCQSYVVIIDGSPWQM